MLKNLSKKIACTSLAALMLSTALSVPVSARSLKAKDTAVSTDLKKEEAALELINSNELNPMDSLNEFSFDFFKEVIKENGTEKNSVMSALSAYYALGMLSLGAEGKTEDELEKALGLDSDDAALVCKELMDVFETLTQCSKTKLSIANAAFYSDKLKISDSDTFKELARFYKAGAYRGELSTTKAREFINAWASEKTDKMIPELFTENLDEDTVLLLINAILLDAKWAVPFDNFGMENTMNFTNPKGVKSTVSALIDERSIEYIKTKDVTGAILDYSDNRLKFAAFMPSDGDMKGFLNSLDAEEFTNLVSSAKKGRCLLKMPKFSIESSIELNDILKSMGVKTAFDPNKADLSDFGRCGNGNVYVSRVFQKAKIDVDEEGTKAAAVTAIAAMNTTALREPPIPITIDHSFFYCVYDSETNVPLFMGVVSEP